MPDSGPNTLTEADIERFERALSHLAEQEKRYERLSTVILGIKVVILIIATVLAYKVPATPVWLFISLLVLLSLLYGAAVYCIATSVCLYKIVDQCRSDIMRSWPLQYLIIQDEKKVSPSLLDKLDKPLLLLPQGPGLNLAGPSVHDGQITIEGRAYIYWYRLKRVRPPVPVASISFNPFRTEAVEAPKPEV